MLPLLKPISLLQCSQLHLMAPNYVLAFLQIEGSQAQLHLITASWTSEITSHHVHGGSWTPKGSGWGYQCVGMWTWQHNCTISPLIYVRKCYKTTTEHLWKKAHFILWMLPHRALNMWCQWKSRSSEGERERVKVKVSKGTSVWLNEKWRQQWVNRWVISECMSERVSDELAMRWHCVEMQMKQD